MSTENKLDASNLSGLTLPELELVREAWELEKKVIINGYGGVCRTLADIRTEIAKRKVGDV